MTHDEPTGAEAEANSGNEVAGRTHAGSPAASDGHELPLRAELQRKALHLLALVIPLGMLLLGKTWSLIALAPLTIVAVAADVLRVRSAPFARRLYSIFGFMMRPEERPAIGSRPVINGASWVLISATLLSVLFPIRIAVAAFASFMVADAAAAVVGRSIGRIKWPGTPRTVEGSLAFFIIGILAMAPIAVDSMPVVAAAVLAGAAIEIPRWSLNDNVRVPFVMACLLYLL